MEAVAQIVEQVHHALDVPNRQCDKNHVRAVFLHVLGDVAERADQVDIGFHFEPVAAAVIEEAGNLEAHRRVVLQALREFQAAGGISGNDGIAVLECVHQEAAHDFLRSQRHENERERRRHPPSEIYPARIEQQRLCAVADCQQHSQEERPSEDHVDDGGQALRGELRPDFTRRLDQYQAQHGDDDHGVRGWVEGPMQ
jgi:hypothetical protein